MTQRHPFEPYFGIPATGAAPNLAPNLAPGSVDGIERRLAALLALDVVNYSRLMARDEEDTHQRIGHVLERIAALIGAAQGRIISFNGDGFTAEIPSAVEALRCAFRIQAEAAKRNADVAPDRHITLRIGINSGDVVVQAGRVGGDALNIAARLEQIAEPGGICMSARVRDDVAGKIGFVAEDIGPQALKNISGPVHVFRVRPEPAVPAQSVTEPPPLPDRPPIAVLPFANMSGDPEQEYFADGVAEDIITELSRSHALFVIARNSSFTYRGGNVDIRDVGRKLGVRYVLEGSVRRGGDRVRVTAQLIEADSRRHIWAERYDRAAQDVFAIQDEITHAVATAIAPAVADAERQRALRKPPGSLTAWEAYQRGLWHMLKSNLDDHRRAQEFFQQAIAVDENFGAPYTALAYSYSYEAVGYITRTLDDARVLAKYAARKAIAIDPSDADAQAALAWPINGAGFAADAYDRATKAIATNPNSSLAYFVAGLVQAWAGPHAEGRAKLHTAMRLNPHDPINAALLSAIATAYYFEGNYEACAETARRAADSYPGFPQTHRWLAVALGQLGRTEEARAALQKAIETAPRTLELYTVRRPAYFRPHYYSLFLDGLRKAGWSG